MCNIDEFNISVASGRSIHSIKKSRERPAGNIITFTSTETALNRAQKTIKQLVFLTSNSPE